MNWLKRNHNNVTLDDYVNSFLNSDLSEKNHRFHRVDGLKKTTSPMLSRNYFNIPKFQCSILNNILHICIIPISKKLSICLCTTILFMNEYYQIIFIIL